MVGNEANAGLVLVDAHCFWKRKQLCIQESLPWILGISYNTNIEFLIGSRLYTRQNYAIVTTLHVEHLCSVGYIVINIIISERITGT